MRSLRAVKYRKKYRKLLVLSQMLAIWYVMILSAALLTSDTFAYFSDTSVTKMSISSGTWWDGSELEFIGKKETENIKACPPELIIELRNKGFAMIDSTEYEVYYIENGNPKNNGEKVAEGKIEAIKQGETTKLTYEADENGSYMFKVYQVSGYKDNYDERTEIWSKKFMVKCIEDELEAAGGEAEEIESEQEAENEAKEIESVQEAENDQDLSTEDTEGEEEKAKAKQEEEKEDSKKENSDEDTKAEQENLVEALAKAKNEEELKVNEATEKEEGEQ